MKKQKQNLPANFASKRDQILAKPGTNEFGSDLKLANLTSPNTYKTTGITAGINGYWESDFTWNSTAGYTIGTMHRHQAAGPSPDDVFGLIDDRTTLSRIGASAADKKFYENNSYTAVILNNTTYIIKINLWGTVQGMFIDFNNDRGGYATAFQARASGYKDTYNVDELTATTKILKDLFGDAIDLYKAPASSTAFAVVGIDQDGKLIVIQCP
ncbi:hypothetical protein EWM62_03925 [Mucilaginibacter terrigena]|uniref:Uncharacterized protein n=1 Tax=Mucilaginibacter terrigena TaxID=2492395 RepID=A0A4Q5LNZ3_9SPHI|nr:hypothetical protein [Mucilaginibacter terrigena]RYU91096.1 hypothetical protein EWM62_03925 [Mucilaginibacter terrigena]